MNETCPHHAHLLPYNLYEPGIDNDAHLEQVLGGNLCGSIIGSIALSHRNGSMGKPGYEPPPPLSRHAEYQGEIVHRLCVLMKRDRSLPECPLHTSEGVKAIDVVVTKREPCVFLIRLGH